MNATESNTFNLSEGKHDIKFKSLSAIEERLMLVLKEGPLTRDQLVKRLKIPRTTIYDGLHKLILRNEVKKYPVYLADRNRGRPKILFQLLDQ